jgi:hypothetical protein
MLKMLRQLKEGQQKVKREGGSPLDNPTRHLEREVSVRVSSFCIGRPVDTKNFISILYYHFQVFKRYLHKMLLIVLELRSWFSGF